MHLLSATEMSNTIKMLLTEILIKMELISFLISIFVKLFDSTIAHTLIASSHLNSTKKMHRLSWSKYIHRLLQIFVQSFWFLIIINHFNYDNLK